MHFSPRHHHARLRASSSYVRFSLSYVARQEVFTLFVKGRSLRIESIDLQQLHQAYSLIMSVLETGEGDSSVLDASQAAVDVAQV